MRRRLIAAAGAATALWGLTVAASPAPPVGPPTPTLPAPPVPTSTPVPAATPTPTPVPTPTPTQYRGSVSISPTIGSAGSTITVVGSGFAPGGSVTLYWDTNQRPIGAAVSDSGGAFKTDVRAVDGDLAQHAVCADPGAGQAPACATFKLEAAPTPSPSATPTAVPSSTATAVVVPGPTLAPRDSGVSPVAALLQPPFVIFPALVLLAAIGGAVFWIVSGRRRRPQAIPAARVSHAAVRPPARAVQPGTPVAAASTPPRAPVEPPPTAPPAPGPRALGGTDPIDLPQPGD